MFNCTEGNVGGCFCAAVMLGSQEFQHMWIMTEDKKKKNTKNTQQIQSQPRASCLWTLESKSNSLESELNWLDCLILDMCREGTVDTLVGEC